MAGFTDPRQVPAYFKATTNNNFHIIPHFPQSIGSGLKAISSRFCHGNLSLVILSLLTFVFLHLFLLDQHPTSGWSFCCFESIIRLILRHHDAQNIERPAWLGEDDSFDG